MSFNNTKTPLKPTTKARYQVPLVVGENGAYKYILEGDLLERFIRYFPKHTNREMMTLFGLGFSTLQRFKREYGLQHDKQTIIRKQAILCKQVCEENGWYDSLRGKPLSPQCQEAAAAKRATGWHPLDTIRKDKRRYKRLMEKRAAKRQELMDKERMRVEYGLPQHTNLHLPFAIYNKPQIHIRETMKRRGYILGDKRNESERMTIYYTSYTVRSSIVERHADKLHFTIALLDAPARQG